MGKAMMPLLGLGLMAGTGGLGGLGMGALGGAGAGAAAGSGLAGAGSMATGALAAHGAGSAGLASLAGAATPSFFGAGGSLSQGLNSASNMSRMVQQMGLGGGQEEQSAPPLSGGSMSRGGGGPVDFLRAANLTQAPQQGISALQSFLNGGMQA
jgi:hypothetical protein